MTVKHSTLRIVDGIHGAVSMEFADAATRVAATGFVSTDVHKIAVDLDTGVMYRLTNHSPPTWSPVPIDVGSGNAGFVYKTAGGYAILKCNLVAVTDPLGTDDETQGYQPGSQWYNIASGKAFLCRDATTGAADWYELGGGGGPTILANIAAMVSWLATASPGDAWVLTTPKRAGVVDDYGNPAPHPYTQICGCGFPTTTTEFGVGSAVNGELETIAGTPSYGATGFVIANGARVRIPIPVPRFNEIALVCEWDTFSTTFLRVYGCKVSDPLNYNFFAQVNSGSARLQSARTVGGSENFYSLTSIGWTGYQSGETAFIGVTARQPSSGTSSPSVSYSYFGKHKAFVAGSPVRSGAEGLSGVFAWGNMADKNNYAYIDAANTGLSQVRITEVYVSEWGSMA